MVAVDLRDIFGVDKETAKAMVSHKVVHSEEEYREFVRKHPLPDGHVWGRWGVPGAKRKWKVYRKKKPEISTTDTELEQRLEKYLERWGYGEHFEHDCRHLGYQLDFADSTRKVALEPGAAYWHTPDSCSGETKNGCGEKPGEVYSPPTVKDMKKQRSFAKDGWQVLWINEDGLDDEQDAIRKWLARIYE